MGKKPLGNSRADRKAANRGFEENDRRDRIGTEGVPLDEESYAEAIARATNVIVLVLDAEGRIVRFNPYMEQLSGYSLSEVKGKDWFGTFIPSHDQKRLRTLFSRAVNKDPKRGNVNAMLTKNRGERMIEWYLTVLPGCLWKQDGPPGYRNGQYRAPACR